MKYIVAILFAFIAMPLHAAGADLKIDASTVRFSQTPLVAGETVRIYGTIENISDVDVSGYASFFQGSLPIGQSQVISVIAGGNPEEVYVDFTVPSSEFNVRIEVVGTDPQDTNSSNNVALTPVFVPILDADGDGVADVSDNCPNTANPDQFDGDADGEGNSCDQDDDNDTLTDSVEAELGTDPTKPDTDDDGVMDAQDVYPLDPSRHEEEVLPPQPTFEEVIEAIAQTISDDDTGDDEPESDQGTDNEPVELPEKPDEDVLDEFESAGELNVSPNAVFGFQKQSYNTYNFVVKSYLSDQHRVHWDFADGGTSSKKELTHTFDQPGVYTVSLTIQDDEGGVSKEKVTVHVPFFTLENPLVLMSVGALVILLLLGILGIVFTQGKKVDKVTKETLAGSNKGRKNTGNEEEEDIDEDEIDEEEDEEEEDIDEDEEEVVVKAPKKKKKPTKKKKTTKKGKKVVVKEED